MSWAVLGWSVLAVSLATIVGTLLWLRAKDRECDHRWLIGGGPREFIPVEDVCLRCARHRVLLPWGQCLGGHPLADHYTPGGQVRELARCRGPR